MNHLRSVEQIVTARQMMMGKTHIKQPLPIGNINQISPFLLLHHFGPTKSQPGTDPLGVGPHPHRGFEPVTFLYHGGIKHHDSRGNTGYLKAGDVQWMTAGRGIIHSELASPEFLESGGTMEGIQLWVNLSKANKMVQPRYQDVKAETIPVIHQEGASIKVVAGRFLDQQGPVETYSPVLALQLELTAGASVSLPINEKWNSFLYLLDGAIELADDQKAEGEQLVMFENDGSSIQFRALENTRILLMAGEPIDEPLAQHGPFVMNTQTEILEAMRDYQMGKMGVYIEDAPMGKLASIRKK